MVASDPDPTEATDGPRLSLRAPKPEDAGFLHDLHCEASSVRYTLIVRSPGIEAIRAWARIASVGETAGRRTWIVAEAATDHGLGLIQEELREDRRHVHFVLLERERGKGIMTAALRALFLNRSSDAIWQAVVDFDNFDALRLLDKLDFNRAAILREHRVLPAFGPAPRDCVVMVRAGGQMAAQMAKPTPGCKITMRTGP